MGLCRGDGDGAAAACVLRSSVVAERARRGGRVCVAAMARRVSCEVNAPRDGGSGAVAWWRGGRDAAGASRQSVFDAARRTLTNCLKGCTITALTSDILLRYLVAAGSLSLSVSLRQLHHQRSYGVGRTAIRCTAIVAC